MVAKALLDLLDNTAEQPATEKLGERLSDVPNEPLIARWLENFQTLRPTKLITHWLLNGQRKYLYLGAH